MNGRPFGCKPNALTAELSAPTSHILHQYSSLRQISDCNLNRNSWNTWNNFEILWLRQLKSEANSLWTLCPKFCVLVHFHVLVGDGAFDDLAVSRFRVAGPVLHQGARYVIGLKVRDPEAPTCEGQTFLAQAAPIAAGADLSRVSYLKAVQVSQKSKKLESVLALDTDLALPGWPKTSRQMERRLGLAGTRSSRPRRNWKSRPRGLQDSDSGPSRESNSPNRPKL